MICPCCNRDSDTVERRRSCTAYADDESNFVTLCLECFEEREEYIKEQWEEYYAGRF